MVYGFFNPLGPVISGARETMLLGHNPNWPLAGIGALGQLCICSSATASSKRLEEHFADIAYGTIEVENVWKKFRADKTVPKVL